VEIGPGYTAAPGLSLIEARTMKRWNDTAVARPLNKSYPIIQGPFGRGASTALLAATVVGAFALVPQIADRVRIPVVAAGGIADRRGIVAAPTLGAAGAQIETAFLACDESDYCTAARRRPGPGTHRTGRFVGRASRTAGSASQSWRTFYRAGA
jgi:NAD(P)H-dependent flavin oxidoreductase YrpB (nitropropane dioxygenase family)